MEHRAFFVLNPRRIEELTISSRNGKWESYMIVKTIRLSKIDFGNFITDMRADRQFIEDHHELCGKPGPVTKCLLVRQVDLPGGVLVVPLNQCHVGRAALYTPINVL